MKRLILFSLIIFFLAACDKDPIPSLAPNITTENVGNVEFTTAEVNLSIADISNSTDIGFLYSISSTDLTFSNAQKEVIQNFISGNNSVYLKGLTAGTNYYYKAYATNGVDYIYGDMKTFTTGGVQDIDGNVYKTVTIGNQVWMAENLKTTKYSNGQSIPNVIDTTSWSNLSTGAWCNYNNDASNGAYYGKLYNWYAISDNRNIAPIGWHVPTDAEWTTLENYLIANGYNYDGTTTDNKITKALAATTDWITYSDVGVIGNDLTKNNKSGFSALPAGMIFWSDGVFWNLDNIAYWWTATLYDSANAWMRGMGSNDSEMARFHYARNNGLSVRCVKDF